MPSTRKQKAKERRSRQLDMLSDVKNVDIMLGSYSRDDEENNISENEVNLDSGSSRPQQSSNVIGEDFRSLLNTNSRENREITIETTRLIKDEISSQLSRKLNEIKTSLNSQIQNAILAAITDTVLPSIQNTLSKQGEPNFTIVDPRCNEPHQGSKAASSASKNLRSSEQQRNPGAEITQETWGKRSKTSPVEENHRHMSRDRPLHTQHSNNDEPQDKGPQVPETTTSNTPSDPINRLAEVLVGMNNRPSAQTLMVRPVSTTTLTFDGKSEKFELFEDLFRTMIKMQPDMTETIKLKNEWKNGR